MFNLTKTLERKVREIRSSIEAQSSELAAYEKLLEVELAKGKSLSGNSSVSKMPDAPNAVRPGAAGEVEFSGNKTAFILGIVRAHGAAGAAPKEIAEVFTARKIARSDNLIYTTLSALAKQKKLKRRDGRYFGK